MSGLPVAGLLVVGLQQRPSHPYCLKTTACSRKTASGLGFPLVVEGEDNSRV